MRKVSVLWRFLAFLALLFPVVAQAEVTTVTYDPMGVTYHHGPVLGAPKVVSIYVGTEWSTVRSPLRDYLDYALRFLTTGPYLLAAREYSGAGPGTFARSVLVPLALLPPAGTLLLDGFASPGNPTLDPLFAKLVAQRLIPAPDGQTLYFFFLGGFYPNPYPSVAYAYHSALKYGSSVVPYAVMPWHNDPPSHLTSAMSHELVESVTDPFDSGYFAPPQQEVGDLCVPNNYWLHGILVQLYYSAYNGRCIESLTYTAPWKRFTALSPGRLEALAIVEGGSYDQVHMAPTGNFAGQYWRLIDVGNGNFQLVSQLTGDAKCLDAYDGTNVQMSGCGDNTSQFWHADSSSIAGYVRLKNRLAGGTQCLAVGDGGASDRIHLVPCAAADNQLWRIDNQ